MRDPARQGNAWLAEGRPVALVRIEEASGSTPREAGAFMLVTEEETAGTIGGGELEWQAMQAARDWLRRAASGRDNPATAGSDDGEETTASMALGPQSGQCCGGRVTYSIRAATSNDMFTLGRKALRNSIGSLWIFGGGHVGRAVSDALLPLPLAVRWVDERPEIAAAASDCQWVQNPLAEVDSAWPGAAFLILTHSHARDFELCSAVLRRGDFAYLGLIGSATKRARFERGVRELGLDGARLVCPVGGGDVNDKRPEVIAALTVAEIIRAMKGNRLE